MTDTTQPPAETLAGAHEPNEAEALAARLDASIAFKVYSSSDNDIRDAAAMLRRLAALTRRAGGDVSCKAAPDHVDIMETIQNAADDWQKKGYLTALAEVRDMANVGRALMDALPEGYCYINCPSEIVSDLQNERDEAVARAGGDAIPEYAPDNISHLEGLASYLDGYARDKGRNGLSASKSLFEEIAKRLREYDAIRTPKPPAGGDAGEWQRAAYASIAANKAATKLIDRMMASLGHLADGLADQKSSWADYARRLFTESQDTAHADRLAALALPAPVVEGADRMRIARESVAAALPGSAFDRRVMDGRHDDSAEMRAAMRAIDATLAALSEGRSHG